MICARCGKKIPEGSDFCPFCNDDLAPDDDYGVYDEFDGGEPGVAAADGASYEDRDEPDVFGGNKKERDRKIGRGAAAACVVLSVIACIILTATALSGVARYVARDRVIRQTVVKMGPDAYSVNTGDKEESFASFLGDAIEENGKTYGFKKRELNLLMKDDSVREYFADIVADYKNDLFKGATEGAGGEATGEYDCGAFADWMYENSDVVKRITGVAVDERVRDRLKSGLGSNVLSLGSDSFKEVFGIDRDIATFAASDVFFYICAVLSAGLFLLIFIISDFNFRYFLSCAGVVLLAAGIALLLVFGYIMIAGSGSGFLSSVMTSASLIPFVTVCGAAVLLGVFLEVIYYLTGKKRRYR